MSKRIDVNDLNVYYGDFLAVEGVSLTIEPRTVTAFIGPSGCGKSTFLRTLNRMHEVIPGARVEGEVLLDGNNLYGPGVDPVLVRRQVGHGLPAAQPVPHHVDPRQRAGRREAQQPADAEDRRRRPRRAVAAAARTCGTRSRTASNLPGSGPLRRPAAAALHRPRHRGLARRAADGRALLGPRPDLHARDRGPHRGAQERLHDRHRHPQHAAGRPASPTAPRSSTSRAPASPASSSSTTTPNRSSRTRPCRRPRTTSPAASADPVRPCSSRRPAPHPAGAGRRRPQDAIATMGGGAGLRGAALRLDGDAHRIARLHAAGEHPPRGSGAARVHRAGRDRPCRRAGTRARTSCRPGGRGGRWRRERTCRGPPTRRGSRFHRPRPPRSRAAHPVPR